MPTPWRRDLLPFVEAFVAQHRGLRLGRMFGAPAIYAGRRLSACLMDDGVVMKLPAAAAERARALGGRPWASTLRGKATPHGSIRRVAAPPARGRSTNGWVLVVPKTAADANRLLPLLEAAARHVATTPAP